MPRRTNEGGESYLVVKKDSLSAYRTPKRTGEAFLRAPECAPSNRGKRRTCGTFIAAPESAPVHHASRRDVRTITLRPAPFIDDSSLPPIAEQDEGRSEDTERATDSADPIAAEQQEAADADEATLTDEATAAAPDGAEHYNQQVDVLSEDNVPLPVTAEVVEASPIVATEEHTFPLSETEEQPAGRTGQSEERPVEQIDPEEAEAYSITEGLARYLEQNEDPRIAWMESRRKPNRIGSVEGLLSDSEEVAVPIPNDNLDGLLFEVLTDLIEFEDAEEPAEDSVEKPADEHVEEPEEGSGEEGVPTVDSVAYGRLYDAISERPASPQARGAMSELLSEVLCSLLPNGRSWDAPRIRRKKKRRRRKRASEQARRRRKERPRRAKIHHIKVETRPLGKKKKKRKLTDFLPLLGLLVAVVIFAWPVVSDAYKQWAYSQTISEGYSYDWEDPKYQEILEQANLYNKMLAGRLPADVDVNSIWPYEKQLDYGSGGMIAWVEIPDLSLKLPIYHGSNDESLMAGVGHMERTSLPVGGDHTKCAISGHTGMQNERMFDSLDDLEKDDVVIIHALGKDLYYSVTYKEVVEPTALDKLYIDCEDSQLVLITCTPRGINSHRLLVHATQVDEESTQVADTNPMDAVMNYLLSPTVIFFTVMMLVLLVLFLLWLLRWRKKKASVKVEELDEFNTLTTKLLEEGLDTDDSPPDR